MTTVSTTSLPGIYFLPTPAAAGTSLPPLDVAGFVGFAERGPLNQPVALNDYSGYLAVFGAEMPLAQYPSGETLYAYLSASVEAFFSNGGQHCFVVRIAGPEASQAAFSIPGLTAVDASGFTAYASIAAASEGGWASSKLTLAARLQSMVLSASSLSNFCRIGADFTLLWNTGGAPDALLPGETLRLTSTTAAADSSLLLVLADVRPAPSGSANKKLLIGASLWQAGASGVTQLSLDSLAGQASVTRAERLRFDLVLREEAQPPQTLSDLAFSAPHPRFWGDVALLESSPLFTGSAAEIANELAAADRYRTRRSGVVDLSDNTIPGTDEYSGRLGPLSDADRTSVFLPLAMTAVVTDTDFVTACIAGEDDLATFPANQFLDPWLADSDADSLYANAQNRYWVQTTPLTGLHSLFFQDDVAMIATPDAILPSWAMQPPAPALPPPAPVPAPAPDLSQFTACVVPAAQPVPAPPVAPPPPLITLPVVQPDTIFSGAGDPASSLVSSPLMDVQSALQIFCEARGDVVAVLTLPAFYQAPHCRIWLTAFRERLGVPANASIFTGAGDLADLSYVGVYHPWMQIPDGSAAGNMRAIPADGAVCGTIAAREHMRNVWVAPANVPLAGVLGLAPLISESDRLDLFQRGFNILHAEPRDFRIMSAHTLSDDATLLQISVRRLMILLRKMLLIRGNDYVFQNDSPLFRAAVQMSLEGVLQTLFLGGAFAGKTASQSYLVDTGSDVNTPQSVDLGQFIVEIRVAPSQPTEFMTVQLIRTGDNLLTAVEA